MLLGSNVRVGNVMNKMLPVVDSVSYLLDTYAAFAAYSTRKLSSTATNCMDVREDGTGTTATIGFSAGWVDEAAIASHCGANNGFVSKWYDQQGSADATQATTTSQPKIYNGTTVEKLNNKPALTVDSGRSGTHMLASFGSVQTQPNTIFNISYSPSTALVEYDGVDADSRHNIQQPSGASYYSMIAQLGLTSTFSIIGFQHLTTSLFNGSSSVSRIDGTQRISGDIGLAENPASIVIGNDFTLGAAITDQTVQEYIFYNSDETANFSAIETDINTAFSIF